MLPADTAAARAHGYNVFRDQVHHLVKVFCEYRIHPCLANFSDLRLIKTCRRSGVHVCLSRQNTPGTMPRKARRNYRLCSEEGTPTFASEMKGAVPGARSCAPRRAGKFALCFSPFPMKRHVLIFGAVGCLLIATFSLGMSQKWNAQYGAVAGIVRQLS